jgi:DNA-directed RNA polymerase subunit RPC12/RpoP
MKAKKRHTFQCWNCGKTYTLKPAITETQKWIVACPYCLKEAVVRLQPYKKSKPPFIFTTGTDEPFPEEDELPAVIPTESSE